ncbi:Zn-ribbon domain-containing OB-fold protein [Bradyrhizobium sp. CCBAU 51753]|uniref:Zn-ribbon domain-containing OB-fold protein n=1 Tax=Bradyrhizobium sp. CCBAU 51753 TaxID=1325100 RepID=UPI00188B75CF|nr:hypothetical protein [Bradyrhizobium sp. CCBAU 51753]QOZ23866.1 hypothetical protein XH93_09735 [Bradyrhizobium sp. CCBAU 51753]
MLDLLKPNLYGPEGTESAPGHPCLKGGKCGHCGHVFFPFQVYGCEICGATGEVLKPFALGGCGTLIASAKVHMHSPPAKSVDNIGGPQAPFVVGSIKLDDGPTIRTLLIDSDERPLKAGDRMVSKLVPIDGGGKTLLDLRFTQPPD